MNPVYHSKRINAVHLICIALVLMLSVAVFRVLPASASPPAAGVVSGGDVWAEWTFIDGNNASFLFTTVSGTANISNRTNVTAVSGFIGVNDPSSTNFPSTFYTPTPPQTASTADDWMEMQVADAASPAFYDLTVTFSQPVANPKFHFLNLDAGLVDFSATTDTGGGAVSVTRLSGNNEFEVVGADVNDTPRTAVVTGCEANDGTNPEGACGTVRLDGSYQTVAMRVTDTVAGSGGDGFSFTISKQPVAVGGNTRFLEDVSVSPLDRFWQSMATLPLISFVGAGLVFASTLAGIAVWHISHRRR